MTDNKNDVQRGFWGKHQPLMKRLSAALAPNGGRSSNLPGGPLFKWMLASIVCRVSRQSRLMTCCIELNAQLFDERTIHVAIRPVERIELPEKIWAFPIISDVRSRYLCD